MTMTKNIRKNIQVDSQRYPMEYSPPKDFVWSKKIETKSRKFRQNTMWQNQSNRVWHIVFWRNFSKLRFDFGFSFFSEQLSILTHCILTKFFAPWIFSFYSFHKNFLDNLSNLNHLAENSKILILTKEGYITPL